jgi:hypothetical protein
VLDGVYTCESPWADPVFHKLDAPTDEDVARLCRTVRDRVLRLLQRRGLLDADPASATDDEPPLLEAIAAASVAGRVALGERAGRALTRIGARPGREVAYVPGELCAQIDGFSLHVRVRIPPGDRDRLEHLLCRYVARPAIATERLSLSNHGNVLYRFRRPWRDRSPSKRPTGAFRSACGGPGLTPRMSSLNRSYSWSGWRLWFRGRGVTLSRTTECWHPQPPGATASFPVRGRSGAPGPDAVVPPNAATPGPSC